MTKSGKHCVKRRNCMFCAISSFVTMFSKSCLLQRRPKASIWGKGLNSKWLFTPVINPEVQIRRGLQLFSPQYLSYYPTKPHVVRTQKNRLIETILLSTHNIGLADKIRILEQAKCSLSRAQNSIPPLILYTSQVCFHFDNSPI